MTAASPFPAGFGFDPTMMAGSGMAGSGMAGSGAAKGAREQPLDPVQATAGPDRIDGPAALATLAMSDKDETTPTVERQPQSLLVITAVVGSVLAAAGYFLDMH